MKHNPSLLLKSAVLAAMCLCGSQASADPEKSPRYRLQKQSQYCDAKDNPESDCEAPANQNIASLLAEGDASLFGDLSSNFGRVKNRDLRLDGLRVGLQNQGNTLIAFSIAKNFAPVETDSGKVNLWLAGLSFGGVSDQLRIIDPYFSLFLGSGRIEVEQFKDGGTESTKEHSNFLFAAEPEIGLGINITSNVQVGVGLGYRIIRNSSMRDFRNADFQGWGANFHLLAGSF
jgi:hypothetical protein